MQSTRGLVPEKAEGTEDATAAQYLVDNPPYGTIPPTVGSLATGLGGLDLQAYVPSLAGGFDQAWAEAYLPTNPPHSAGTSTLLGGGTPAGAEEFSPKGDDSLLDDAYRAAVDFNLPTAHDEITE